MSSIHLADRLSNVRVSPTVAISNRAKELKRAGRDIISLAAGEPDFDTPQHIQEAARDAMARGETHYTAAEGIIEFREAVCTKLKRDNGLDYSTDEIIVGAGGKQIIFNAMMATLEPGDEVIIQSPYWVSYPDIVLLFGAKPVIVDTSVETGFLLTADQLEGAITPKTRWLFLNSPSNPSGAVYGREDYEALGDVLKRHPHVMVMTDEIYETIIYSGSTFASFVGTLPELKSRSLIVNGLSKSHAMTGWRLGYGAADPVLIKAMTKIQGQSTLAPCSIAQWAAVAALTGPQESLAEMAASFDQRRAKTLAALNQISGISCFSPGGAFYLMVSLSELLGKTSAAGSVLESDSDFVMALMEEQGVSVVPGSAFGTNDYFRLSFATEQSELDDACNRIAIFCDGLN